MNRSGFGKEVIMSKKKAAKKPVKKEVKTRGVGRAEKGYGKAMKAASKS